jgi:geranylgeranyl pyrophosphate synthase
MPDNSIDFSRFCDRLKFHIDSSDLLKSHIDNDYFWNSKFIRGKLCLAIGSYYGINQNTVYDIAAATEFIHNASLIHDDIIDNDEIRRGELSICKKLGNNNAILLGDLLISMSYSLILNTNINDKSKVLATSLLSSTIDSLVRGVYIEINNDFDNDNNVLDSYINMITEKTGKLIQFSSKCLLSVSNIDPHTQNHICDSLLNFACAYQINDDFNDFSRDNLKKEISSDISNSRPNIFSIVNNESTKLNVNEVHLMQRSFLDKANESLSHVPLELASIILSVLLPYVSVQKDETVFKLKESSI